MSLTLQDKLALMMTGVRSQRELARELGISHQRLGRWLREGEEGGAKQIPDDVFTRGAIDAAFSEHRERARKAARHFHVPYTSAAPVVMQRKPLHSGEIGDRVFVTHTQYIREDVRRTVFEQAAGTNRFVTGAVRSIVSLRDYFRERAAEEIERRGRRDITVEKLAARMEREFLHSESLRKYGDLGSIDADRPFALFTRSETLYGLGDTPLASRGIESQFRSKHEPATGAPGTVAADQYLFQLAPANYAPQVKRTRRRAPDKRIRGRGPK